jgi:uncharacterized protein (UPF0335 family)
MHELCSQHGKTCETLFAHESRVSISEEKIEQLEGRVEKIEEEQAHMIAELREVSEGFRAMATKIDKAVGIASKTEEPEKKPKTFSQSLNAAWSRFQDNIANIIIYGLAFTFAWAFLKTVTGDWKETPKLIKWLVG